MKRLVAHNPLWEEFFAKEAPGFHIHGYELGNPQIQRHLAFRDYLRIRPDLVLAYARMKRALSDRNGAQVAGYQDLKKPWVDEISIQALKYFANRH